MKLNPHIAKLSAIIVGTSSVVSCATFHEQTGRNFENNTLVNETSSKLLHEVVIIGDAGNADQPQSKKLLQEVESYLKDSQSMATLLFIGDNIYPLGMPKEGKPNRELAENKLNQQIALAKSVNGKTIFLAGNHDWYHGLDGLQEQKDYVENALGKKSFLPRKYEAIDAVEINDQLTIITIDSEWFIQNWDKHPSINEESFIKTREDFFEEFRSLINKNQNKITLVAIHHPMVSNGNHGGYFSARQHLYPYKNVPLPVFGTIGNYLRKTSGASPADTQHTYYRMLVDRLTTITKNQEQVVFVSGHEHNLQYIEQDGIKQVISGAGSKTEETRSVQKSSFSVGKLGFATLKVFENNKVDVVLHTLESEKVAKAFEKTIVTPVIKEISYPEVKNSTTMASVYPKEKTEKSDLYTYLFGKHFRSVYGTEVEVPVADLSTLYGGLSPIISGGGNQSLSLRLQDTDGKQYVMRGLQKSTKQFLQSAIFKDTYVKDKIADTTLETFIDDYYTTSHPFTPFIIGHLSDAVQLYHTNPKLFYVPKQNTLGKYNETYGDQLYMIEERPHKSQKEVASFGNGNDIVGTTDVLQNMEADEKYKVDTDMYLRARIFDFLIGDWDRHADQWRWVEKTKGKEIIYQPIPRDRDQAFAKIDGALLRLLKKLPALRHMQNYQEQFAHPRWINKTAFLLDKVFLQNTSLSQWQQTAQYVATQITDEVIQETFDLLPKEVQAQYTDDIVKVLKSRREQLVDFVETYYKELFQYGSVVGTNKKDKFVITTSENEVNVAQYRLKKEGEVLVNTYQYNPQITKEIWVFGLDDDDQIEVKGTASPIRFKLIGGRNNDVYAIDTKGKFKIIDYKSKKNTFTNTSNASKVLKDQYALNQYDYRKAPINTFSLLPNAGYNKDNGVMVGFNASYDVKKFNQNPYSQKHQLGAKYDFATSGAYASYSGAFKDYSANGFWTIEALLTSSNFSKNFFGLENLKTYDHERFEENYYRVRTSQFEIKPSYEWKGRNGSSFLVGATYESTKIEETNHRLIDEQIFYDLNDSYQRTDYYGARAKYQFTNYDSTQEPTIGLGFSALFGTRFSTENSENHQYLQTKLNWVVPLTTDRRLTWSSSYVFEKLFGDDFHFYQAASIGSNNGLRGYRQQRFIGHGAFVTSQDIRFKMNQISNGVLPLSYGIFAGFDTGRVWSSYDTSNKWYQSYGGGIWLNALDSFTARLGIFSSKEENILFNVGLGFAF